MVLSRYCRIYPHPDDPNSVIFFSTKRASTIVIPESMIGDVENGNLTIEEKTTLVDLGFLVESAEGEREEMLHFFDEPCDSIPLFAAKVVMNLDCNLACRYCFEGNRKGKFYMTKGVADLFLESVKRSLTSKEEIRLTFYGGEPLLSLELISYISRNITALAKDNGLVYTGAIITNGTLLTGNVAKKLHEVGIKEAVVTLDGPKDNHNHFRPFKSGKGSFDVITKNLREACEIMDLQVNGNFTRENYRDFPLLLDYMMAMGLTSDKISLVRFGPVTKESEGIALPDFHDGCDSLNEPWLLESEVYLREEILRRGYTAYNIVPSVCSLDMKDQMLINYDGSIYKCPGLIGRDEYKAGDLLSGILDRGEIFNTGNWKIGECLDCCYLPLCFGGCRYMKLVREGTMKGVDCRRPYFDAILEPFILQNARYGLQG